MVFRAPIIVLWGEMLCTVTPNNSLFVIGGGYCFGFAINFGVSCMDASGVFVTHAILPMLSAMAFHVLRKEKVSETIVRSNKRVMLSRFPFALLIGIGLFGFVMRMLFDFSEMRVDVPDEFATVYAGLAVSLAVSIFALLYRRDISYVQFGRLIMPATVIIALSIAATENGHQSYEAFLIASVWMVYKLFSWAIIRAVAFKSEQL